MSNGLFIQSYPAPGVQIVPATYTVGKGGYVVIGTLTLLIVEIIRPTRILQSPWLPLGLLIYFVAAAFAVFFFRSFRLEIRTDGISYANFFRKERFIAFAEISTVVLFSNRWSGGRQSHLGSPTAGTIIITPKVETGKPVLKVPLWLFSDPAESQVAHLLRPEEWDT